MKVILSYVKEQRKDLDKKNQAAVTIIVFRGQMMDPVTQALKSNNIILVKIPPYLPTSLIYCESFNKSIFQMQIY